MRSRTALRWAVGLAILLALAASLDGGSIVALLGDANPALVVAGVAGLTALHLVGAAAWRSLVRSLLGLSLGWGATIRHYYAAQAIGGLTPANLGSDVYRVTAVRGPGDGIWRGAQPVVVQRATSYLAVVAVAAAALVVAAQPSRAGLAVASALLILPIVGLTAIDRLRPSRIGRWMPRAVRIGLSYGLVLHLCGVGLTFFIVLAVDPSAASAAALAAVAVSRTALLIPLTPSGLGVQETVLAVLFVAIGLPAESAVAASLLARLSLVSTTAIGAACLATGSNRTSDAGRTTGSSRIASWTTTPGAAPAASAAARATPAAARATPAASRATPAAARATPAAARATDTPGDARP